MTRSGAGRARHVTGAAIAPPVSATSFAGTPYSMITKEKHVYRVFFFRDHEVVGAGHDRRVTGAAIATSVSGARPLFHDHGNSACV
jgi:hypothetical protein